MATSTQGTTRADALPTTPSSTAVPRLPARPRGSGVARRAVTFAKGAMSTPGRMTVWGLLVLVVILGSGIVSTRSITERQAHHETLLAEIEPVANATQTLYSSLTIADSAANTAFISGGLEPADQRQRYLDAVARASSAIVAATQGIGQGDPASLQQLATINYQLTTYTGLIETARTNNRAGNPVASAYLAEASSLMQDTILPTAADLYDRQSTSVGDSGKQWSRPPWPAFLLLGGALVALVVYQRWLTRVSGRRINLGLAVATGLVALALLWTTVSGLLTANSNIKGLSEGAAPMNELTRQRIAAQKIRAQETLNLVRRTDPENLATSRAARLDDIRSILLGFLSGDGRSSGSGSGLDSGGAITRSISALDEWVAAQDRADAQYQLGNYQGAIEISTGRQPGESGLAFDQLDASLQQSIEAARERLRSRIADARATSSTAPAALTTLSVLAAMASIGGVAPRIREYL